VPAELEPRAILTRGLAAPAILAVQQQTNADLLLLGTHGATSEDHTSVTDKVLADSRCPVLVLHESELSHPSPPPADSAAPRRVLVPTDFSRESGDSLDFALELAAILPLRLHLLHVVQGPPLVGHQPGEEALYTSLRSLIPAELRGSARYHVRFGDPSTEIAATASTLGAQAIVMGAHARGLLRRFLTRDTSLGVVHRTDCPIWVVPTSRAA
jgi:nucleotide-binding universal stress UspA family protein